MSFSGKPLTCIPQARLEQLAERRQAILLRIAALKNAHIIAGHSNDADRDLSIKAKSGRLTTYQHALANIETEIAAEQDKVKTAITSATETSATPAAPQSVKKNVSEITNIREWYSQFERDYIIPAIARLHSSTRVKGKEVWNDVDDSAVRQEFINLAHQILSHYKDLQLAINNLPNYIEAIEIADRDLTPLRKTMLGYTKLLPLASKFAESKAKKTPLKLDGELGRAFATFKKGNRPEGEPKKVPLITITCDAERDFALMAIKFMRYFILRKNANLKYDQRSLNTALSAEMVLNIFNIHEGKFAQRIHDYEAAILLATPTEALSPSSKRSESQSQSVPSLVAIDNEHGPALSDINAALSTTTHNTHQHTPSAPDTNIPIAPAVIPSETTIQAAPVADTLSSLDHAPKKVVTKPSVNRKKIDTIPATDIPQITVAIPTANAPIPSSQNKDTMQTAQSITVVSPAANASKIAAPTTNTLTTSHVITIKPAERLFNAGDAITNHNETPPASNGVSAHIPSGNVHKPAPISEPALPAAISDHVIASPAVSENTLQQENVSSPQRKPNAAHVTVPATSPRITNQSSTTTVIAQPASAVAQPSFFARHKKKILWGLGIGLLIGLSIATAGVFAVAFSGAAAATAAIVGATTIAKTVGIGIGLTAASGLLGAASTAAGCAVADSCKSTAEEPVDHAYTAIPDNWDTARIHRQAGMPVKTPAITPSHQSVTAKTEATTPHVLTNSATNNFRHDDTRIVQPTTRRI